MSENYVPRRDFEARLTEVERQLGVLKEALVLIKNISKLNSQRLENIENWLIKLKDKESK